MSSTRSVSLSNVVVPKGLDPVTIAVDAMLYLHKMAEDPAIVDALNKVKASGSVDWPQMMIAIGEAAANASGSPVASQIVQIIESFIPASKNATPEAKPAPKKSKK